MLKQKNAFYTLFTFCYFLFLGVTNPQNCSAQNSEDNLLSRFRDLSYSNPDSTQLLVKQLKNGKLNKSEEEQLHIVMAWTYAARKQNDSAVVIYRDIISNKKQCKNVVVLSEAYLELGKYFGRTGKVDSARTNYQQALKIGEQTKDYKTLNTVQNELGYLNLDEGNFNAALTCFKASYQSLEVLKDSVRMASCLNNIFVTKYRLGKLEEATHALLKSVKLKEKHSHPKSYIASLVNLANLYHKLGNIEEAGASFQKAYNLAKQYQYTPLEATALGNLGVVAKKNGAIDSAIEYYEKAYALNDSIGRNKGSAAALQNLGVLYNDAGKNVKSLACSLEALNKYKRLKAGREEALCCCNVAKIYIETDQLARAKKYLEQAKAISQEINTPELHAEVNKNFYKYFKAAGNSDNALKHFEIFIHYNDSLHSIETEKTVRNLERKYQSEKKQAEIEQLEASNRIKSLEVNEKENQLRLQRVVLYSIIGIVLLLVILAYTLFQRYKLKQQTQKSELRSQKLEIEQRMIRSQMNPHFIFNSLGSIQNLIITERIPDAEKYLNKFARLLRLVLENSRHEFVALSQEIQSLQNYIEIEKLRFEDKFDFQINDQSDEADFIAVPPMLMQPFIENAIHHGLKAKEGKGNLSVSYEIFEDKTLICTLEDNGIGRKASQKAKTNGSKHNSLALQLMAERIAILKNEWNQSICLEIIDIEEAGKTGTKVILKLPVKDI